MLHLYLFILEITPLEVGMAYDELPSHLTLMSRFLSNLSATELAATVKSLFMTSDPVHLVFSETIVLGPKKVTAHMASSPDEQHLHNNLRKSLDSIEVKYQYPEFIGINHKPHVTKRDDVQFAPGSERVSSFAYLIEVVDKQRVVRARFELGT